MANKWKYIGCVIAFVIGTILGGYDITYSIVFCSGVLFGGYAVPNFVYWDSSS